MTKPAWCPLCIPTRKTCVYSFITTCWGMALEHSMCMQRYQELILGSKIIKWLKDIFVLIPDCQLSYFILFDFNLQVGSNMGSPIFTLKGNQGNTWNRGQMSVPQGTASQGYKVFNGFFCLYGGLRQVVKTKEGICDTM